jgi:D-alanyl-D-alanine carboxypeptidase
VDENDPSVFPVVAADSVILCDAVTGRVLYEKNPDQPRAVASTQKLLTALVIAEAGDLSAKVRLEREDGLCEPTKLGLKDGETYCRYDLLKILLIKSMNSTRNPPTPTTTSPPSTWSASPPPSNSPAATTSAPWS